MLKSGQGFFFLEEERRERLVFGCKDRRMGIIYTGFQDPPGGGGGELGKH